jgi:hypothetical protein
VSYLTQDEIASNRAMVSRVAQCVASEGETEDPDRWAHENRRGWSSAPGWDAAWESAQVSHEADPNYDPGSDESVITDGMILSQVQGMLPVVNS